MKRRFPFHACLMMGMTFAGFMAIPMVAVAATLTPEEERQALIQIFQVKFPGVPVTAYASVSTNSDSENQMLSDRARYGETLAKGKQLWARKFRNGRNLASCFPNGGRRVASTYPQFDSRTRKVITLELAINNCLRLHGESEIDLSDLQKLAALTAYARSLANDQRTNVRVQTPGAKEKFAAGRTWYFARAGQQNQACASCHIQYAGNILRNSVLSPAIGQTARWPRIDESGALITLQMQYQRCLQRMGSIPAELGGEELNNLEFFHTYLSNGLPIKSAFER